MDFQQFTPNDLSLDAIRERHRQVANESRASSRTSVLARLLIWLLLALATAWAVLGVYAVGITSMFNASPTPESEYRPLLIVATVLFLLSLAPLFWPKASRRLMAFGVLWALFGGLVILDFW